jgi:hypothetical protein
LVSGVAPRCQRGPGKELDVRRRSRFEPSDATGVMPAKSLGRNRAMAYRPFAPRRSLVDVPGVAGGGMGAEYRKNEHRKNKRPFLSVRRVPKGHRVVKHVRHPSKNGFLVPEGDCAPLMMTYFGVSSGRRPNGNVGSGVNRIESRCGCEIRPFRGERKTAREFGAAPWWANRDGRESWQLRRALRWRR